MFDFGLSELMVIGVVLLIVVGPERLPKVARTAGHLLGRVQRYVSDVKSDIQRERQLEELKKLQEQVRHQAQELETSVREGVGRVESGLGQAAEEVRSILPDGAPSGAPGASVNAAASDAGAAETRPQLELGLEGSAPSPTPNPDKSKA